MLIKPGKVTIGPPDEHSLVKVTQGDAIFYGTLRTSQNKQFCVVFRNGYDDSKKWINGTVILIEKDDLLWIKEFERPCNGAVSDNGRIALVHTTNRDYSRLSSSQKEFIDLGSKLTVIERSGEEIFKYNFGSNVEPCTISPDGNLDYRHKNWQILSYFNI